jgi:hypothetical protein
VPYAGVPPSLHPWNLSVGTQLHCMRRRTSYTPSYPRSLSRSRSRDRRRSSPEYFRDRERDHRGRYPVMTPPIMLQPYPAEVTSGKSAISATFQIPGRVNIPSDGLKHHVTIAKMTFTSKVLWYSMPMRDIKTYLKVSPVLHFDHLSEELCFCRRQSEMTLNIHSLVVTLTFTWMEV